ncbi:hypothetical protein RGU70_13285 [Herbaspirillum sp. RTI4]|uniref:hypothetical protein n=1 Tax=Herbaspirillum sp. RTI4 TaxID=3048640 RepID=UPI002AB4B9F6|nr:hypothetical protein [Herbaspirillum sp. RTI4]MDY7579290.1 hypothetical protein [Herbaspirillum sp. RTI4]MEA9982789.1 hypothetical protein [Herbaspirillum sp. RTI4]
MLIEESRDITGLTFAQLDEKLDLPDGQSYRYSLYPIENKTRAPQANQIQELEYRVAKLLKRAAHIVVVENNGKIANESEDFSQQDIVEGKPGDGLNLRQLDGIELQLGYDGDWPTYRRLKSDGVLFYGGGVSIRDLVKRGVHSEWPEMLRLYAWQWGGTLGSRNPLAVTGDVRHSVKHTD